ncbi:GrrA/OscA1 family cyclophane-containing rSAM-modified RiPP [Neosynechococcus sphagnicola]|uniref:GrrA/OscA1 family cyclophane-containing rSAM-modified RiPP n=1 Tax=Neosynechococcus sphagnicola TaxID=1501145 RepID=UPI0009077BA1|nr:GrrA/OscA1 family cyclophane-containing rSAM-modified RiPP [Neosynechococcus sphagnicola]
MDINTTTGFVGLLLALSALTSPEAMARVNSSIENPQPPTIEARMAEITATLRQRETLLETTSSATLPQPSPEEIKLARAAWGNGGGRGVAVGGGGAAFRNSGGGGAAFRNNGGGAFRNGGSWGNGGWRDGGGFADFRNW